MAQTIERAQTASERQPAPTRRRLSAEQRRHLILEAARKTFSASGDPAGTTIKSLAAAAGVSEGMIYRHFESKDELFSEAIVEPLRDAIDGYRMTVAQLGVPAAHSQRDEIARIFWTSLITSMEPILPLLGLVLFGDPKRAKQFWQATLGSVVETLEDRWKHLYAGLEPPHPSHEVAIATLGTALVFALEARHNSEFELASAIGPLDRITAPGFFPPLPRAGRSRKGGKPRPASLTIPGPRGSSRAAARSHAVPSPPAPSRNKDGQVRRRLPPEERRHLILVAAREAFSKTGDLSATTVKAIASQAKISEGVIYRYFESKDELFYEAIVEPLRDTTRRMSEAVTGADLEDIKARTVDLWNSLIGSLGEMLPMLGLVLFGENSDSGDFYHSTLSPAIDEMAGPWESACAARGIDYPNRLVALSCVGIALAFALDARYHRSGDPDGDLHALASATLPGFWPES